MGQENFSRPHLGSRGSSRATVPAQERRQERGQQGPRPLVYVTIVLLTLAAAGASFANPDREWSMEDLAWEIAVQETHQASILERPGVIGMGITMDKERPAFLIMVAKGHNPSLPTELDGIPVVVERDAEPQLIHGGTGCTATTCDPNGCFITTGCHDSLLSKPVLMGNSTSSIVACDAGTLGFKACSLTTHKPGYVTAGHVATRQANGCEGAPIGTAQVHRGTFESYAYPAGCTSYDFTIGTLSKKALPTSTGSSSSPNFLDAAFVLSKDIDTSWQATDVSAPTHAAAPTLNACVTKSGRTSGQTFGKIDLVNTTLFVNGWCFGGASANQGAWFGGLFRFSYANGACGTCTNGGCSQVARGGDSGSAIVHPLIKGRLYGLLVFNNGPSFGYGIPASTILSHFGLGLGAQCQ